MNLISRTITGTIIIILGALLIILSFFESFFVLIYGIPLIIIGLIILFNKKEDEIEKIKTKRRKK
ncbi:MAG TPA: hypothetical protein ENH99_02245 [Candidatus Pacearchaeota archaeon]|nr:hypothetical protein [Candidatus Pacearchaeota archaeon]